MERLFIYIFFKIEKAIQVDMKGKCLHVKLETMGRF